MTRRCLLLSLLVSACASSGTPSQPTAGPNGATGAKPTVEVCEWEEPIGSNIRTRVCHREEDLDADRRQAQDFLDRPHLRRGKMEQ